MNIKKMTAIVFALTLTFAGFDLSDAARGGFGGGGSRGFSGGGSRGFSGGGSRGFSGGGSKGFSGGGGGWSKPSAPSFRPSAPRPSAPSVRPPSSPGRGFFGGSSSPAARPQAVPPKPSTTYDTNKQKAAERERSRQNFEASKAKERSAQKPSVSSRPSRQEQERIRDLQRDLNYEKMKNRDLRQRQFYSGYYNRPIPSYYHSYNDGFNIWFWMWLMDRPRHDRDTWVYNHRDSIDPQRYAELRRQDADLDRRLQALETQGVAKNPSYVPPGIDRDMMYSDEKVKEVYAEANRSSFPWGWAFGILIFGGGIYLVFYGRFFRRRS